MPNERRVEVDRSVCIGAGNCENYAPATFATDEEGLVVLLDPDASDSVDLDAAIHNCPSGAIRFAAKPSG